MDAAVSGDMIKPLQQVLVAAGKIGLDLPRHAG
jgi:hypothetical protein